MKGGELMAYKALYRKYRPTLFNDVVGQDVIVKTLLNAIKENKISHAYLFNGPRGTGKTSVAKILAKTINCLNLVDGQPCNKCESCISIINNQTADIIEIDAASNNGVDEIRELKNKINLVPHNLKYKVYIIDEIHMLSIGAFNALLKTLEEPPSHVVFILATTEPHKLPLTIVSRCQDFYFKKITPLKIEEKLNDIVKKEKINITKEAVKEIALLSDGSMRDAIGMLEQLYSFTNGNITIDDVYLISSTISNKQIADILILLLNKEIEQLFSVLETLYQEGKDFIKITELLNIFLKDVLLYKKVPTLFSSKESNNLELYEKIIVCFKDEQIYQLINEINTTISDMKESAHPKISFELMILKIINNLEINDEHKLIDKKIDIKKEEKKIKPVEEKVEKESIEPQVIVSNDELKTSTEKNEKEDDYKHILVNNTVALAEKKFLNEVLEKFAQLNTYLINKDFKKIAALLIDANVVAASSDHMIITYKYDSLVDNADEKIEEIEYLINKLMNRKYKIVSLNHDDWLKIRVHYVKLKKENKEIPLLSEDNIVRVRLPKKTKKTKISKEVEDAIDIFGEDLIEMKG